MKRILPLVTLAALAGCASTSVEFMIGGTVHDDGFRGTGPTATGRVRYTIDKEKFCEFEHVSFMLAPSQDEDTLNHIGCGVRFGGE